MPIISNDGSHVQALYIDKDTLSVRAALHDKYSTNPYGAMNWTYDQLELRPGMRVLVLGCGTGRLWQEHIWQLPEDISILLTDFSPLMLDKVRAALPADPRITYAQVDILAIPYPDDHFDLVIANHMLYHVPDVDRALSEVARVVKPNGRFLATTIGDRSQHELWDLYRDFEDRAKFTYARNSTFTLENGEAQLRRYFSRVERRDYIDSLKVTNPEDLLAYIYSLSEIPSEINAEFRAAVEKRFEPDGVMSITKEQGMFVSMR